MVFDDAYYVTLIMDCICEPKRKVYVLKGTKSFRNTEQYVRFVRKTKLLYFRLAPKRIKNTRDNMTYVCTGVTLIKPSEIKKEFHVDPERCAIFKLPFYVDVSVNIWNTLLWYGTRCYGAND